MTTRTDDMIIAMLQSLEGELVNLASDHRQDRLEQLTAMQRLVIETANALLILEITVGWAYFEDKSVFCFVRDRILYYLVYFEHELRKMEGENLLTIEVMQPYYRLAAYQNWQTAFKHVGCCWSITAATQRMVLSNAIHVWN